MESIVNYFAELNLDIGVFLKSIGMLVAALLVLAVLGRFVFGKRSALILAVSSAIGILFVYVVTILLGSAGKELQKFIAPLPFVTIENETMYLFNFQADYTVVPCGGRSAWNRPRRPRRRGTLRAARPAPFCPKPSARRALPIWKP